MATDIQLHQGDCLEVLKTLNDNSIDSVVTDPPYGINFMGKKWDYNVPNVEVWQEVFRVLKLGGHALVACGTRTQHRMAVNLEDAGFEIRDIVAWVYGSGFPKSQNIGKKIDQMQGNEREIIGTNKYAGRRIEPSGPKNGDNCYGQYGIPSDETKGNSPHEGWGTALKPAMELFTLCRKPLAEKTIAKNVLKYNTGGINIDGCRVQTEDNLNGGAYSGKTGKRKSTSFEIGQSATNYTQPTGRFPANFIHDGSDEVVSKFPDSNHKNGSSPKTGHWGNSKGCKIVKRNDSGSASRFFYTAKASKSERNKGMTGTKFDGLDIVLYLYENDKKTLVWNEKLTIQEEQKAKPLEATEQSLRKAIAEYGVQFKNVTEWNIVSYGKLLMEKYLTENKFITKTETSSITSQQILNWLHLYTTKEYTQDALLKLMDGGNLVASVDKNNTLTIIINVKTELVHGANPVKLKMQLQIREKEKTNFHSTVKPIKLMKYLCRLITPVNGIVLDPYMGSGSTGIAAKEEGFKFTGIELDKDYFEICKARINAKEKQEKLF